jgi:hypothetical protein
MQPQGLGTAIGLASLSRRAKETGLDIQNLLYEETGCLCHNVQIASWLGSLRQSVRMYEEMTIGCWLGFKTRNWRSLERETEA